MTTNAAPAVQTATERAAAWIQKLRQDKGLVDVKFCTATSTRSTVEKFSWELLKIAGAIESNNVVNVDLAKELDGKISA